MQVDTNSILITVKKLLGVPSDYEVFDADIMININAAFSTLHQLGVGTNYPFTISGVEETWDQFINDDKLESVKQYVYLKTRLVFDPPSNSFVNESYKTILDELTWRLNTAAESDLI